MSYAIEIALSDLTEEELISVSNLGRLSVNETKRTFRSVFLSSTGVAENDPRLTVVADNLNEWRTFVSSETYTRAPTAEDLEQEVINVTQSMYHRINQAVSNARTRAATDLPFQTEAYKRKLEQADSWDGETETPSLIAAYASRKGLTAVEAKAAIQTAAAQYHALLDATEALREQGYKAAEAQDNDALTLIINQLNSIGG